MTRRQWEGAAWCLLGGIFALGLMIMGAIMCHVVA